MEADKFTFTIDGNTIIERLDKFLVKQFPEKTRQYLQNILKEGAILLNGKKVKAGYLLKVGDKIEVEFPEAKEMNLKAKDIPLTIVYEDKDVIVINKAPGLVIHPVGKTHREDSLVNALLHHCKETLSGISGTLRPGIVHRLDKDTSGLMVIAKNDEAHQFLMQQFKNREIDKNYLALLNGHLMPKKGMIDAPIGRHYHERKKMAVSLIEGRQALTKYEVLEYREKYTFVKVRLLTGRTHQIRVHFASIGYPLIGDPLYGNPKLNNQLAKKY